MEAGISETELICEGRAMQEFFHHPPEDEMYTADKGDAIYEKTLALMDLTEYIDNLPNLPWIRDGWKMHRAAISRKYGSRISVDTTPQQLETQIQQLITEGGWTTDDWQNTQTREFTPLWRKYEERYARKEIFEVRYELWKVWSQRRLEMDRLHNSSALGKEYLLMLPNPKVPKMRDS